MSKSEHAPTALIDENGFQFDARSITVLNSAKKNSVTVEKPMLVKKTGSYVLHMNDLGKIEKSAVE